MHLESWEEPARGLRRYSALVSDAVPCGARYRLQLRPNIAIYLALDAHLPDCGDRGLAVLWDEQHGWAAAIETASGQDLVIVSYLGVDVLPPPRIVAQYVTGVLDGNDLGQPDPPGFRNPDTDGDLPDRLAAYAWP